MSLIITKNFKRAKTQDAAARDKTPDGWWEGKTIFAAFGWGKSVKGKVVSHRGGVIKLEDGTKFKESDAYDLYAISSSASDAAEFHVGQRVRAKDPAYEYSDGKALGAGMFTVKEVNSNGDVKLDDYGDVWISPSALVEANDTANDSAAKFRIGQEVIVKTKYTEPYKARIVGLWDMSQNGPYDEQGYLIKNIKGGGVESMPEHALSLVTAKDSAEPNDACGKGEDAENFRVGQKVKHTRFGTIGKVFEIAPDGAIGVQWGNGQAYYGKFHAPLSEIVAVNE